MLFFGLAAVLFVLSQLDYFLLNKVICKVNVDFSKYPHEELDFLSQSNNKVDGSFIATILETASVVVLYYGWKSITEGMSVRFWRLISH